MSARRLFAASLAVLLTGCASTATELPPITEPDIRAEAVRQERQAMATRAAHIERLMRVSRPILLSNAELCPKTRRDVGIAFHEETDYPKELRLAARRELGATAEPRIFRVAIGGPAYRVGLKAGDQIIVDGRPVGPRNKAFLARLDEDETNLTVRRDGQDRDIVINPETVCHSRPRLKSSSAINAFADGRNITVTSGMMRFAESDDELALIIGHELAHNTMGHIRKVIGNYILSGFATRYTRPFESESDYVGLYYMVRAGFEPDGVEAFWRRLADVDPRSVNRAKTHPTFPDRYLRIAAAREEIRAKQAAGEPLVPNYRKTDNDEDPDV